jgi:AraC-like DNA-binding protein/mannose-6-phosphate isomerase-like protein (cupin superfamily)
MQKVSSDGRNRLIIDSSGFEYKKWKTGETFPVDSCTCNLANFCNGAFDFHWHDGPELTVVLRGRMEYLVNDKRYYMEEGDCVFANSGAMHSGSSVDAKECIYLVVSFLTGAIDSAADGFFAERFFGGVMDAKAVPSIFFKKGSGEVANLCTSIHKIINNKEDSWELAVKGLLCQLWQLLYKEAKRHNPVTSERLVPVRRVKKAIRYMNEHYQEEINISDLAALSFYNENYFMRLFKEYTGKTLTRYLTELRIEKSRYLLLHTNLSITDIAFETGFNSASYFIRKFQELNGETPQKLRKNRTIDKTFYPEDIAADKKEGTD